MKDNTKYSVIGLVSFLIIIAIAYWYFTPKYGETSEDAYDIAIALFSTCNQKDVDRLQEIAELVDSSVKAGKLQPQEAEWLNGIISKGESGNWEQASIEVRRLMKDQVQAAPALPEV